MSNHSLRFSSLAQDDIQAVLQHTYETWGEIKQIEYTAAFNRAFERLLVFPEVGRLRSEIGKDLRSIRVESHVIFYRITGEEVIIERVVHLHFNAMSLELE